METQQPKNLLRFFNALEFQPNGHFEDEELLKGAYVSKWYTPRYIISLASINVHKSLDLSYIENWGDESKFVKMVEDYNIRYIHPNLYRLIQSIALETYTLSVIIEDVPEGSRMFTKNDADGVHGNINYVIEALEKEKGVKNDIGLALRYRYMDLITALRELDVDTAHMFRVFSGLHGGGDRVEV